MTMEPELAARINAICLRPVEDLVPHRAPMVLIDKACGMEGDSFKASLRIRPGIPFFSPAEGGVPAWVGLEYMAQTVGAYSGALGLARGGTVKPGMLLGTRDFSAAVPVFPEGQELEVLVRIDIFQEGGVSSMDCRIRTAAQARSGRDSEGGASVELAQAQITVIEVPDIRTLLKERS